MYLWIKRATQNVSNSTIFKSHKKIIIGLYNVNSIKCMNTNNFTFYYSRSILCDSSPEFIINPATLSPSPPFKLSLWVIRRKLRGEGTNRGSRSQTTRAWKFPHSLDQGCRAQTTREHRKKAKVVCPCWQSFDIYSGRTTQQSFRVMEWSE